MRREMITVPALLGFAAFVIHGHHHVAFAIAALVIAGLDALGGS